MLNHDNAEILYTHDSIVPAVKEAMADVTNSRAASKELKDKSEAEYQAYLAEEQSRVQEYIDEWGCPPPTTKNISGYRYVYERIEYMTKHWFSVQKHYTWEEYTKLVIKYITWQQHDDYHYIFSTYRLKGDIQILYAKYNGITTDSVHRILGY